MSALHELDLPAFPKPQGAVVVHVPSLLRPRERRIANWPARRRGSLGGWLRRNGHDLVARRTICAINGEWIPRQQWIEYCPGKGDVVLLLDNPHAGGDGSNPLAIVLMVAVMIVMPEAVGFLTSSSVGLGAEVAKALYLLGTNLLISALTAPPKPPTAHAQAEMAQPSPTYTLAGQGNANRLGAPRPRHYGRFRFTPAYCAQAFGQFVNNENYLYEIFDVGLGEYQVDKITIEDSDISAFADIQYEVVPPGGRITLVPGRVHNSPEVAGQELLQGTWIGGAAGFVAVPAGLAATGIGVDFVCPQGLFYVNDDGSFATKSLQIRFQAQAIDDAGVATGPWVTLADEAVSAATNTPQRCSRLYSVTPGRYAIRATRIDNKDTSSRAGHEVVWAALRAHLPGDLIFPENTVVAMKARASGQLTEASARKVFVQGIAKVKTWSPTGGWTAPVTSRSIAWAAADMLMATYGRGAPAAAIDLAKLYQLDQVWAARGDRFDASFDTRSTVAEALTGALKCGRAQWFQIAGLYSFARDEAVTVPSATFTPMNIVRGSVEVEYVMPGDRTSDHVVARYFDTAVFNWREVDCTLTGNTAVKPAKVTYFGIGEREQAWREGVTDAAENLYRRRIVKFATELEGRLLLPLDTIALSHILVNRAQTGEVVAFTGDDGEGGLAAGAELVLTSAVEFTTGQTHYLIMSTLSGGRSGPWRVTAGSAPDRVLLAEAVAGFQPYVGGGKQRARYSFGVGSEVYVLGKVLPPIKPKGRTVEIQMVVDDPRVHTADQTNTLPPPRRRLGTAQAARAPGTRLAAGGPERQPGIAGDHCLLAGNRRRPVLCGGVEPECRRLAAGGRRHPGHHAQLCGSARHPARARLRRRQDRRPLGELVRHRRRGAAAGTPPGSGPGGDLAQHPRPLEVGRRRPGCCLRSGDPCRRPASPQLRDHRPGLRLRRRPGEGRRRPLAQHRYQGARHGADGQFRLGQPDFGESPGRTALRGPVRHRRLADHRYLRPARRYRLRRRQGGDGAIIGL